MKETTSNQNNQRPDNRPPVPDLELRAQKLLNAKQPQAKAEKDYFSMFYTTEQSRKVFNVPHETRISLKLLATFEIWSLTAPELNLDLSGMEAGFWNLLKNAVTEVAKQNLEICKTTDTIRMIFGIYKFKPIAVIVTLQKIGGIVNIFAALEEEEKSLYNFLEGIEE